MILQATAGFAGSSIGAEDHGVGSSDHFYMVKLTKLHL